MNKKEKPTVSEAMIEAFIKEYMYGPLSYEEALDKCCDILRDRIYEGIVEELAAAGYEARED